jgi:hypothetical protein
VVTDGVVAFELDFQFAKSKLKNDYPVCSIKRCIHPFEEGELALIPLLRGVAD